MHKVIALVLVAGGLLCAQNPETAVFPGAVATDKTLLVAANAATTILSAPVTSPAETTLHVAAASRFIVPTVIQIDAEYIAVCSKTSTSFTVCTTLADGYNGRGFSGSSAAVHANGAAITGIIDRSFHNRVAAEVIAVQTKLHAESVSVKDFGAIGDGSPHAVSTWCTYAGGTRYTAANAGACLTAVQADYPHVTAVTNEIDWAAIQAGVVQEETVNGHLFIPCGKYLINRTIAISERITLSGGGGGDSSNGCSILSKTADVVGISIASAAEATVLEDFVLSRSSMAGSASGITIGEADATNGAGRVVLRNVAVMLHGGHGIDVLNGNGGVLDNVYAQGNGGDGVHLHSQNTSVTNVNGWRVYSLSTLSNIGNGLYMTLAVANIVSGLLSEGNTGYGLYVNAPYQIIQGYVESNTAGSYYIGVSAFECHIVVRDVVPNTTIVNRNNYIFPQAGAAIIPYLHPDTGRYIVNGPISSTPVVLVYSPKIAINADLGNEFNITATDGVDFAVACPTNANYKGQRITVRVTNGHTSDLGEIAWCTNFKISGWTSPSPAYTRAMELQLQADLTTWAEVGRTVSDVGALYNIPASHDRITKGTIDNPIILYRGKWETLTVNVAHTSTAGGGFLPTSTVNAMYRACGSIVVTTAATAGTRTVTLRWLPHNPLNSDDSEVTIDLTVAGAMKSACSVIFVPAGITDYYIGDQEIFVNNSGGVAAVYYVIERIW